MYLPIKTILLVQGSGKITAPAPCWGSMPKQSWSGTQRRGTATKRTKSIISERGGVLVEGIQHYSAAKGTIHFHMIWATLTKETGLNQTKYLTSDFQEESKLSGTITGRQAIPNLLGMPHLHDQWESRGSSGRQVHLLGSLCNPSYAIALLRKVPDLLAFSISARHCHPTSQ